MKYEKYKAKKLLSRRFLAWVVWTVLTYFVVFYKQLNSTFVICYAIITFAFICFGTLEKVIFAYLENKKIE